MNANTTIIVRTTLLGWLQDLASCRVLHLVPSKQQGRSSKVFGTACVCSHYIALSSFCSEWKGSSSPALYTKPHKFMQKAKKNSL